MDIVGNRRWYFLISALLLLPGIISLIVPPALRPGIDFTSGTAITIVAERPVSEADLRTVFTDLGHPEALIQKTGSTTAFVRTDVLEEGLVQPDGSTVSELSLVEEELMARLGVDVQEVDTVSSIVAGETVVYAIVLVIIAAGGILAYVTWAFRAIPNSFRYGVAAIVALVHDLLLIVGIFSILGKAIDLEVNAMFIVGLLTVMGYSVNDTIVVFDRIRENVARNVDRPLAGVVNASIMESMGRSLNTSMTTTFVLMALLLFGGATLREFVLVLAIGVIIGTYSSIFIASQFLVAWDRGEIRKVLSKLRLARPARQA